MIGFICLLIQNLGHIDTMGFFCDDEDISKNYQINLPKKAIDENWIPTL